MRIHSRAALRSVAACATCALAFTMGGTAAATAAATTAAPSAAAQDAHLAGRRIDERTDSLGREFWLTFTQNYFREFRTGDIELALYISAPRATTGTVEIPGLSWSQAFSVTPGAVTTVALPTAAELGDGADGLPQNLGIHVTAAQEIAVYGLSHLPHTTDAYLGLPTDALGTEHLILGWTNDPNHDQVSSEFAVVATQDGTVVTYTPTADTRSGVAAGTSSSTTLAAGQVLPVSAVQGDLTGTEITSTKPVTVNSGHMCADVPAPPTMACDHLDEQIPPTSTWGREFLTVPLKTRLHGDTFRMLAAENNTRVSVDGTVVATLDRGEHHEQIIETASTISADKPILVAQLSNGMSRDWVESDPFMMLIPPTEQFLNHYTFATPVSGFKHHYVNVVAPGAAVGEVTLDGTAIPAGEFTPIGSSGFAAASLELSPGSHTMTSNSPFASYLYGFNDSDSYGYPGGSAFAPLNTATAVTVSPAQQKLPVDDRACVAAVVTDQDQQPLLEMPVQLAITGANPGSTQAVTDDSGSVSYCYDGTRGGTDTVTATAGGASGTAKIIWKRHELPISAHGVKKHHAHLSAGDHVVLVKKVHTNTHGKVRVDAYCRPVAPQVSGEVRACRVKVTGRGKVIVHPGSHQQVRVGLRAKAIPKHADAGAWAPSAWRDSWHIDN